MKQGQKFWTREELILVLNLYYRIPFGKMDQRNPMVKHLAALLNRSPSAVALKLVNFAGIDPGLDRKGMSNASKLDREVWNEFYQKWEGLVYESEALGITLDVPGQNEVQEPATAYQIAGKEKEVTRRVRINQNYFRKMLLASYESTCGITGIKQPELLIAGHIKPWAKDEANRMNPSNGILMNALHDKAFENGLITIGIDYKIRVATEIITSKDHDLKSFFVPYNNEPMKRPTKYLPNKEFLEYHNDERFRG